MAVREEDGIEPLLWPSGRAIQRFGFFAALKEAAIDQHAGLAGLNVIRRAGDFATSGSDNGDFHIKLFVWYFV
jgi:hypothetical protein